MKIIVTGSKGQLGSELNVLSKTNKQFEFLFVDVEELDITDEKAVEALFAQTRPDYCINCAAYTAVDKAEEDRPRAHAINVTGALNLARACHSVNATLFHISTDFVFSGTGYRPLSETAPTDPVNYYGQSKLDGEAELARALKAHYIIRTSWLYSSFGNNFVKTMIRLSGERDELNIIADQIGSPTYAHDLARAILTVIGSGKQEYGIYHYSNEGVASWYDFTSAIFEYRGIDTRVKPISTEQYPTPARRPHYSVMDKSKIKATFRVSIPHWRESLKHCLKNLE